MVKTYNKSILRMFKSNFLRLFAISMIITIGISLVTSISGAAEKMREAANCTIPVTEHSILAKAIAEKIKIIGYILPVFFIAVAALAALTTVTRLIEEERPIIACLKTLGYSNSIIITRYMIFAGVCCIIGCALGLIIGNYAILPILYESATSRFDISSPENSIFITQGLTWSAVMAVVVVFTAFIVSFLKCKETPAVLLRAKTPKAGKKVALEYLPLIWKKLKFKYKSSVRNILRYKGRLIMTIISIIGSSMMLFCGIGLFGSLKSMRQESSEFTNAFVDSIIPIATVLIIFAGALAVLVLFNITNINIEERKREIATLRVLGYSQLETAAYIYREISFLSFVGIISGVPLGYVFLGFVFDYLEFGSLEYVKWYIWLISAFASFLSVIVALALLYVKIKKIEMASSLKTVD